MITYPHFNPEIEGLVFNNKFLIYTFHNKLMLVKLSIKL